MSRYLWSAAIVLALAVVPASGARIATIDLGGSHEFTIGSGLQQIPIYVFAEESIELDGAQLFLQIGDGTNAPAITALDLTYAGSLFSSNNTGNNVIGPESFPAWEGRQTITSTGTVTLGTTSSLLAMLTIDTSGPSVDTWPMAVFSTITGSSSLTVPPGDPSITVQFAPGSITLNAVPEPATLAHLFSIAATAVVGVFFFYKRRARTPSC